MYPVFCIVWGQDGFGVILMGTMCAGVSITSAKQAAQIPETHQSDIHSLPTILLHSNPLPATQYLLTFRISQPRQGHLRSKLIVKVMEFLSNANSEQLCCAQHCTERIITCVNWKQFCKFKFSSIQNLFFFLLQTSNFIHTLTLFEVKACLVRLSVCSLFLVSRSHKESCHWFINKFLCSHSVVNSSLL